MPLFGKKSSGKNEMHEGMGHHSLALAYSMKRRGKKAHGGMCAHGGDETCPKCTYPEDSSSESDPMEMERMAKGGTLGESPWNKEHEGKMKGQSFQGAMVRAANNSDKEGKYTVARGQRSHALREAVSTYADMKKDKGDRRNLAKGGGVELKEGGAKYGSGKTRRDFEKGVNLPHPGSKRGVSWAGDALRAGDKEGAKEFHRAVRREKRDYGQEGPPSRNMAEGGMVHAEDEYDAMDYNKKRPMHPDEAAMMEDDRMLGEHGDEEEGPQGTWMAEGGEAEGEDGTDMVGRIMAQRQRMFSKGGQVANEDELEADFSPNEFDDLHLDDHLEQHDTGANSGDEIGDAQEDDDREDIVSRIMRSRRKGPGHNPRPA